MKRLITMLFVLCITTAIFAQAPNVFNYQGVARDLSGNPLLDQNIGLRISILQGSISGVEAYKELHLISTNEAGLFNIHIGGGTPVSGGIETIDWGNGPYFLKIEMDPEGGSNYQLMGTNQLLSVPYALYAEKSDCQAQLDALEDMFFEAGIYTVKDIDGNKYKIVKIGDQVWMAENLKTTTYNDGSAIANITGSTAWSELDSGAYCWQHNDISYKDEYGALYNWFAVSTGKLCPTGWHVPSNTEWEELATFLGGASIAGGKMKETGLDHWVSPNTGATNSSGFTARAGGWRAHNNGTFQYLGRSFTYWASNEKESTLAYAGYIMSESQSLVLTHSEKQRGRSVRCIKD